VRYEQDTSQSTHRGDAVEGISRRLRDFLTLLVPKQAVVARHFELKRGRSAVHPAVAVDAEPNWGRLLVVIGTDNSALHANGIIATYVTFLSNNLPTQAKAASQPLLHPAANSHLHSEAT
jgi:hypothetical protein